MRNSARPPLRARCGSLAVVAACCAFVLGAQAAPAAAPGDGTLESTVAFLQQAQNNDGGFGGEAGGASDPDFSSWVALALAAAGINPQDQARPGGTSAYTYLLAHADVLREENECVGGCTTTLGRMLLVADAAGGDPHDFGGVDLVAELLSRQSAADGFFERAPGGQPSVNDTEFAVLALSPVFEPRASAAVQQAAGWLEAEQDHDGWWAFNCVRTQPRCSPEENVDITAAAIEALNAAGHHDTEAQTLALEYLRKAQNDDGGFSEHLGEAESNSDSTAWVVQALVAAGQAPEAWVREGRNPLQFLRSMQLPDGSISLSAHGDPYPTWNTAYALPALALRALPIAAVPPANHRPLPAQTGQAAGVSAGGGGDGAPLFSTPQPQSQGHTRGGARVLSSSAEHHAARHTRRQAATATTTSAALVAGAPPAQEAPAKSAAGARRPAASAGHGGAGAGEGEPEVSGLLLASAHGAGAEGAAAPGLRSAADDEGSSALASAIAVLIALVALAGAQFEGGRPEAVL